jgi:2-methylcitrate dehydratase PrpD
MLDAQMSVPYSLAVTMLDGEAGIAQFAPERLRDSRVIELGERIQVYVHPDLTTARAEHLRSYLELDTTDGATRR